MNGNFALRPRGVWLVTSLELRQRVRSIRWYVALGLWTLALIVLGLIVLLPTWRFGGDINAVREVAAVMFSMLALVVLFAVLLVLPALSAGSINGDRTAGTLATLQATLLSPFEIVIGKLLAGWITGIAFIILALPSLVPTALLGGIDVFYLLRVLLVLVFLAFCIVALGLGLSSLTNRQLGSVVLTYVVVLGTSVILPVVWGSSAAVLNYQREVTIYETHYEEIAGADGEQAYRSECREGTMSETVFRMDLAQPLIWPNPVILLAETAPPIGPDGNPLIAGPDSADPHPTEILRLIKLGVDVSLTAHEGSEVRNHCSPEDAGYPEGIARDSGYQGDPSKAFPVWPMGAACWLLVGLGGVAVATRRLSVPIKRLGKGTRIA